MTDEALTPLARALGRVPTGLYIVSVRAEGPALGFVASFVMQVAFQPPTVSVAIGKDRDHLAIVRETGRFAVSILDDGSRGAMGAFFKPRDEGESAFDEVEHEMTPNGLPVLSEGLAWMDCELVGEFDAGDHVVVFGQVMEGKELRQGSPSIHLRKNGLSY